MEGDPPRRHKKWHQFHRHRPMVRTWGVRGGFGIRKFVRHTIFTQLLVIYFAVLARYPPQGLLYGHQSGQIRSRPEETLRLLGQKDEGKHRVIPEEDEAELRRPPASARRGICSEH